MSIGKSDDGFSELFSKAFHKASELLNKTDVIDQRLNKAVFSAQRKRLQRKKIGLNESFGRLTRYPELTPLINEYAALNEGVITSIADLIKFLRQHCASISMIEDPALRAHLKYAYDIRGLRGRKKKP